MPARSSRREPPGLDGPPTATGPVPVPLDPARQRRRDRADWGRLVVATSARILLLTVLGGVFWAGLPTVWGWKTTTVMSDSMAPGIRAGDLVVTLPQPVEALRPGRVILVHSPDQPGELRLHRLVGFAPDGELITKGDANPQNDSSPVARDQAIGTAILRTPFVGLPIVWADQGHGIRVAGVALGMLGLALLAGVDAHLRQPHHDRARPSWRLRRRGTLALVAGGVSVVLAVMVGSGASAAFARTTVNPTSTYAALASFPCLNPAPADSPYLSYNFNEVTGPTALDGSGLGHPGTLQSGATRTDGSCLPNASPAIALNGSGAATISTATSITPPSTYSVEIWFRTTSTTGGRLIGFGNAATGASTVDDRMLWLDNAGHVVFGALAVGSKVAIASPAGYANGAWHHAVVAVTPGPLGILLSSYTLYVDGVAVASNLGVLAGASSTAGFWRVGADTVTGWGGTTTPTTPALTGSVDNAAVYTTTLSAAQVSAHYAAGH